MIGKKESMKCTICEDTPRCVVTYPCTHCVMCEKCAGTQNECPFCHQAITQRNTIFIPVWWWWWWWWWRLSLIRSLIQICLFVCVCVLCGTVVFCWLIRKGFSPRSYDGMLYINLILLSLSPKWNNHTQGNCKCVFFFIYKIKKLNSLSINLGCVLLYLFGVVECLGIDWYFGS